MDCTHHKSHRFILDALVFLICFFMLTPFGASAKAEAELRQAFLQAAEQMPSTLEQLKIHAKIEEVWRLQEKSSEPKVRSTTHEVACRGSSMQLKSEVVDGVTTITGMNGLYAFEIRVSENGPELRFLQQMGLSESGDQALRSRMDELAVLNVVCSGYFQSVLISDLIKMPEFTVDQLSHVVIDGKQYVRIDHTIPEELGFAPVVKNAYLISDPARGWAVIETGFDCQYPEHNFTDSCKFVLEDSESVGDVVITRKLVSTTVRSDGLFDDRVLFSVDVIDRDPPKEMFFLSYYGLSEPNFSQSKLMVTVCFFALAAMLFVVWFALGRLGRNADPRRELRDAGSLGTEINSLGLTIHCSGVR